MATSTIVRALRAEEILALLIVQASGSTPILARDVQRTATRAKIGVSLAEAMEFLEDAELIKRTQPPPKTAAYILTAAGRKAITKHTPGAVRDLEKRIKVWQSPHPRDGSNQDPAVIAIYTALLRRITEGTALKIARKVDDDDEEAGPVDTEVLTPEDAEEEDDPDLDALEDDDDTVGDGESPASGKSAERLRGTGSHRGKGRRGQRPKA
jgi:hypothetical protein